MTVIEQTAGAEQREKSRAWGKLKKSRSALAGLAIILFFTVLAVAAPILPIPDPVATSW